MTPNEEKNGVKNSWEVTGGTLSYFARIPRPSSLTLVKKKVFLTLTSDADEQTLATQGLASLRQERILRLCTDARQQGALLAHDDLATLLSTSLSTIKRDLRLLRQRGLFVPIYRKRQRRASKDGKPSER